MAEKRSHKTPAEPASEEISWSAAEHEYVEKDVRWHLAIGGLALALFFIAIWQKNYFFAVFVVVAAGTLLGVGRRRPKIFEFRVTNAGIGVGEDFFPFDRLESFSVREREGALHELIVKQKTYLNPYVRLPADAGTVGKARAFLAQKLPEEEYRESLLDLFAEWIGF